MSSVNALRMAEPRGAQFASAIGDRSSDRHEFLLGKFLMITNRREFIMNTAAGIITAPAALASAESSAPPPIKAIAFDAFPIFDPRGITALASEMCGDVGKELTDRWSIKFFSYSWLATSAKQYQDFQSLAGSALRYTVDSMGISLGRSDQGKLIEHYSALDIWPDIAGALKILKSKGIRLRLLSNLGNEALAANLIRNGISKLFESSLSTDLVRRFKPAPEAYAMAVDAFGLPREQIGFVAFGGWDAIGATWYGYRTAWINRFGLPAESIGPSPEITTPGIEGALALAGLA